MDLSSSFKVCRVHVVWSVQKLSEQGILDSTSRSGKLLAVDQIIICAGQGLSISCPRNCRTYQLKMKSLPTRKFTRSVARVALELDAKCCDSGWIWIGVKDLKYSKGKYEFERLSSNVDAAFVSYTTNPYPKPWFVRHWRMPDCPQFIKYAKLGIFIRFALQTRSRIATGSMSFPKGRQEIAQESIGRMWQPLGIGKKC